MDDERINNNHTKVYSSGEFIITLLIVGIIGLFLLDKISTINNNTTNNNTNMPSFSISPYLSEMLENDSSESKVCQKFLVTMYDAVLEYDDSVGENWSMEAYVNSEAIDSDGVILCVSERDQVEIRAVCTEWDDVPDIGENSANITVEESDFEEGFLIDIPVTVTENRGKYSGYTAKWTITLYFEPIQ